MKTIITFIILICALTTNASTDKNVMIFMAADNDLEEYALRDLQEIRNAQTKNLTIKIQAHLINESYNIIKDGEDFNQYPNSRLTSPKIQFKEFLDWAHDKNKQNFLILWGHGQGPLESSSLKNFGGVFTNSKNYSPLQTDELGKILVNKNISILVFDMCLMQNITTLSHLHGGPEIVIASAQVQNLIGLPYTKIISSIAEQSNVTDISKRIVTETAEMMPNSNYTFSALYSSHSDSIINHLKALKKDLDQLLSEDPYQEFIYSTYYIDMPSFPGDYIDIGIYLGFLKKMDYENNNLPLRIKRRIQLIQEEITFATIDKSVGKYYINGAEAYFMEYFQAISAEKELLSIPQY